MCVKVIIWGLGKIYNQYINTLRYFELIHVFEIVGLTDKYIPDYSKLDGWSLLRKDNLNEVKFDWIIVMSEDHFGEIAKDAYEMGISKDVISYKVLNIPNVDLEKYYAAVRSNITIISNNCWGGILYSTLGLECRSPFKNLFVEDDDYLKLLSDCKGYLSNELTFYAFKIDPHSHEKYPIMRLGDIKIHCNHDSDPEQAKEKWDRRRKKMNWNNIMVEMYTERIDTASKFNALECFTKKILFVPFEPWQQGMYQLQMYPGQSEFYETVNRNVSSAGYMLDILDLLNGVQTLRMESE